MSSDSITRLAVVNTIVRAVAISIVTGVVLGKSIVRLVHHPCYLSFSFHSRHLSSIRHLVIRVIPVIPVIVATVLLSVLCTANGYADPDLKAALTIMHDIGWPSPMCKDSQWFVERGLQ